MPPPSAATEREPSSDQLVMSCDVVTRTPAAARSSLSFITLMTMKPMTTTTTITTATPTIDGPPGHGYLLVRWWCGEMFIRTA